MPVHEQKKRPLLVLDLDETLIHGRETVLSRDPDFQVGSYHIYRRPFLSEFFEACAKWYDIGIWSSASENYVEAIVNHIYPSQAHYISFGAVAR